jgi:hypothetical protein
MTLPGLASTVLEQNIDFLNIISWPNRCLNVDRDLHGNGLVFFFGPFEFILVTFSHIQDEPFIEKAPLNEKTI